MKALSLRMLAVFSLTAGGLLFAQRQAVVDSTFQMLTLPELQNYRVYYVEEMETLQEEKRYLVQRGIEDGERLLSMSPDPEMVDEIIIRLADLYYYRDKDLFFDRMDAYDEALEAGTAATEPRLDLSHSLSMYQRVIDEFPASDLVDDATYNKAFLYEEQGQYQRANQIYHYLTEAYPNSPFVPEANMRLGEFFFNPPRNDLDQAIAYYKKVTVHTSSPRYNEALYKLGWAYYRLSRYAEAISYFTTLIEDIDITDKYNNELAGRRADLRDEAIEYVAISFHDYGGAHRVESYLDGIGRPAWGQDVLKVLGDVYFDQKEEYANAIYAYEALLAYAPDNPNAPDVQRRIIDCRIALDQSDEAILARESLYNNYRKDGRWWAAVNEDQAHYRAYRLSETAMRENIQALTAKAERSESRPLFEQSVRWAGQYLERFPEDPYAYMIRWNRALILDTRLHRFKEALEEYLTISLVYNTSAFEKFAREKGLASIQDAAENAIVVGDSLVQAERSVAGAVIASPLSDPTPLSTAEHYLGMAYDNYIKLYPFSEKTPLILANAGALYYTHQQFTDALRYFKTLVKYFPNSDQIQQVQISILESYFGKQDYQSAEILAKRIVDSQADTALREKARRRWAEAIFFKAEALAKDGESLKAAREYYRVALEVPNIEFADRALFNAGQEFEKAKVLESAVQAYEHLRLTYAASPLVVDAINNLAFDYAELGQSEKAGERYEVLAALSADSSQSADALYNAYLFYQKSGDTEKAAETGLAFAERYPEAAEAPSLFYQVAMIYRQSENPLRGVTLLSAFPERFPQAALGVSALWRAGCYYEASRSTLQAEAHFDRALALHDRLMASGGEGDGYYAADALLRAAEIRKARFAAIRFVTPSTLNDDIRSANTQRQALAQDYGRVVGFKTTHLPEAAYRLGEIVELMGVAWSKQMLPGQGAAERAVKLREVGQGAARFYNEAKRSYLQAIEVLHRVENEIPAAEDSSTLAANDSLQLAILTWRNRAEAKVSEMLYRMAEVQATPIEGLVDAPVPADLDAVAALEYRNQVLFRAVKPQVDGAVAAHYHNLTTSDSLGVHNSWSDLSRSRIAVLGHLLSDHYRQLTEDVLSTLKINTDRYAETVLKETRQPEEALMTSIINLNALMKTYGKAALLFGREGLSALDAAGINGQRAYQQSLALAAFAAGMADRLKVDMATEQGRVNVADSLFNVDNSPFYEEALTVFEDNVFYAEENQKVLLEAGFEVLNGRAVAQTLANALGVRLVMLDTAYIEKMVLPVEELVVTADSSWQVRTDYVDQWAMTPNSEGWDHPSVGLGGRLVWVRSVVGAGATGSDSLFIRKTFDVPGHPLSAQLRFIGGAPEQCLVNGVEEAVVDSSGTPWVEIHLRRSENRLGFSGSMAQMAAMGAEIRIRYIPLNGGLNGGRGVE